MRKWRRLAVCTVGVVLALLLSGSSVVQLHAAVKKDIASINEKPVVVAGESQGIVLDLAGATTWTVNGKSFLFVPVPHTDVPWQPAIVNPMNPSEKLAVPESFVRRSLWFMPVGARMLWGMLVNSNQEIALVFIQRVTRDKYRITIEDQKGQKLSEFEGVLHRLDERIGYGVIEFQPSQSIVTNEVILYDDGVTVIRQELLRRCITICVRHCRIILWTAYCECTEECVTVCDDVGIEV